MIKKEIKKIKGLFKENWEQLNLLILLTPFMYAGCISWYLLSDTVAQGHFGPDTFKGILEKVAFYILVPASLIAYYRFCIERSRFFLWFLAIILTLLCREVHWKWTGGGVFAMLGVLMLVGYIFYDKLRPQISSSAFINLFVAAILCYFVANLLLDQNWVQISKEFRSDIKYKKSLEEFMEILGHTTIALIVLLTPVLRKKSTGKIEVSK